mmetsp:Transcript_73797/g.240375  ORF Transcript_73797/g.240375 Transcript_73797/m.240375 type:complete len:199 (-) Transcript_73797:52-648(-)
MVSNWLDAACMSVAFDAPGDKDIPYLGGVRGELSLRKATNGGLNIAGPLSIPERIAVEKAHREAEARVMRHGRDLAAHLGPLVPGDFRQSHRLRSGCQDHGETFPFLGQNLLQIFLWAAGAAPPRSIAVARQPSSMASEGCRHRSMQLKRVQRLNGRQRQRDSSTGDSEGSSWVEHTPHIHGLGSSTPFMVVQSGSRL